MSPKWKVTDPDSGRTWIVLAGSEREAGDIVAVLGDNKYRLNDLYAFPALPDSALSFPEYQSEAGVS